MATRRLAATRSFAASVFGLILALTPPALWIAWSETMFFAILGIGAVAGGLICLLADAEDPALEGRGDRSVSGTTTSLSDAFLARISGLGPWIHHHRRIGDPAFRAKMESLAALVPDLGLSRNRASDAEDNGNRAAPAR